MNNFFINKPKKLESKINQSNTNPIQNYRKIVNNIFPKPKFSLNTITMHEMRNHIKNMKNSNSIGIDTISIKIIKSVLPMIEAALLNIINTSICTNTYPTALNIAKIIPQLKQGKENSDPNSFRPISILNAISKIIDTVVAEQIKSCLILNNFTQQQHMPLYCWMYGTK